MEEDQNPPKTLYKHLGEVIKTPRSYLQGWLKITLTILNYKTLGAVINAPRKYLRMRFNPPLKLFTDL